MRVIVTGSRDWQDVHAVVKALIVAYQEARARGSFLTVVHGGCPGADAIASAWCWKQRRLGAKVLEVVYEADWSRGRKAGPERNRRMVEAGADKVLAFSRNRSRGTASTIRFAREAGIPVELHEIND